MDRGTHQSMMSKAPFLREEVAPMVGKRQWVVLAYSVAKELIGLRISPPGVKEYRDRFPRWIDNYGYSYIKYDSLSIDTLYIMQYGRTLYCLIILVVIADPTLGPVS